MIEYKSPAAAARTEITEKKSRFIASVTPAADIESALSFIETVKKEYADASHNVYAYRVGINRIDEKYSDDGEPSGTAGLPVLSVIRKEGLMNAAVVVTRYFGGIMLGAGGLVRAYSSACKAGIDCAGAAVMRLFQILSVTVPYAVSGKIQHEAAHGGYTVRNVIYTENVELIIHILSEKSDMLIKDIIDMTSGSAAVVRGECIYLPAD